MAFVKVEQALIPHFSKLQRQSAALHTEVIRKLLLRHVFPYARFLEPCAYKCVVYHTNKSPADEVFLICIVCAFCSCFNILNVQPPIYL